MRLLSTETGHFVEINDPSKFEYAILSHTWDLAGEQSYREVREIQKSLNMPVLQGSAISDVLDLLAPTPSPEPSDPDLNHNLTPVLESPVASETLSPYSPHREATTPAPVIPTMLDHLDLSSKIKCACALARRYGHHFIWIDSCCIDSESSSDLSEAINSMFRWYRDASVCYAFLADVPVSDLEPGEERTEMRFLVSFRESFSLFRQSRWFTRGWTLQELVAPRVVIFISQEWLFYGSKATLADIISEVTHIDCEVLTHRKRLRDLSVVHRMSWASRRTTTRVEDQAYSLLGIFDIHMPILYGEGQKAFVRLQHAILKEIPDESLFVWNTVGYSRSILRLPSDSFDDVGIPVRPVQPQITFQNFEHIPSPQLGLLADRPSDFSLSPRGISSLSHTQFVLHLGMEDVSLPKYSLTPYGVNARFPFIPISQVVSQRFMKGNFEDYHLALLACGEASEPGSLIGMVCVLENVQAGRPLMKRSSLRARESSPKGRYQPDFRVAYMVLSRTHIERLDRTNLRVAKVLIPNTAVPDLSSMLSHTPRHTHRLLPRLSPWNLEVLRESGFAVRCLYNSDDNLHLVRLLRGNLVGVQLRFQVIAAFICVVNVWITPFYQSPATVRERLPDASPMPTFQFKVRDIRQEECARVAWPSASGREATDALLRLTLYYVTSSNSCSLTVEALRSDQDSGPSNASLSTITPLTTPSIFHPVFHPEYSVPVLVSPDCSDWPTFHGSDELPEGSRSSIQWQESSTMARGDEGIQDGELRRSQKRRRLSP